MAAGADSIDDMDLLRHGAMDALFGGVRAPSTLGSHLRCYTWGNVAQLEKAGREFLIGAGRAGAAAARRGHAGVHRHRLHAETGLRAREAGRQVRAHEDPGEIAAGPGPERAGRGDQHAAIAAPVIAATRLRGGNAASARGAASLVARAIGTARDCGCTGTIVVRLDSAFYNAAVIGAIRRGGARFSVTVPMNASIRAAIAAISDDAWTPIRYPRAIWDDQLGAWISDAEVAEMQYTAFASKKGQAVTARLIVRRVRDLNKQAATGRTSCSPSGATTPCSPTPRSSWSRPKGSTATTPSWSRSSPTSPAALLLICHPGCSPRTRPGCRSRPWRTTCCAPPARWPSLPFAKARAATIRRDLIAVAARTARHGRGHLTLHLPEGWHREHEWLNLLAAACGPPAAAA